MKDPATFITLLCNRWTGMSLVLKIDIGRRLIRLFDYPPKRLSMERLAAGADIIN